MWSHWFATGTYSIEKISYERKSKYQVQLLNDDYLTIVPITTQQVRCFCKHIHIWNSIGVRVKKGVSARMPKKDWVSSEAQWTFGMNVAKNMHSCDCHIFNLHIISIERSTHVHLHASTEKKTVYLPALAVSHTRPGTHKHIETICFHLVTQLCFRTAFTWDFENKRQLKCNQYQITYTLQNSVAKLQSNICICRAKCKVIHWN